MTGPTYGVSLTFDDQVGSENTHRSDTDTGLRGTVRGTEAGEHDGGRATHGAEERLHFQLE